VFFFFFFFVANNMSFEILHLHNIYEVGWFLCSIQNA